MSTLKVRRAVAELSPLAREVFERLNLIHAQDWPFAQKQAVQEQMMGMLTPDQKAQVERETLRCAINLQAMNSKEGNRATRRLKGRRK
jgi:hypothetical protein